MAMIVTVFGLRVGIGIMIATEALLVVIMIISTRNAEIFMYFK